MFADSAISSYSVELPIRPRRKRKSAALRSLTQETYLHPHQLVVPLFIIEGEQRSEIIQSMPGIERISIDLLIKEATQLYQLGIRAVDLLSCDS